VQSKAAFQNLFHAEPMPMGRIPHCSEDMYLKEDCISLAYSPAGDARVEAIVGRMKANNGGGGAHALADSDVRGFATPEALDAYMMNNPEVVQAAVHFKPAGAASLSDDKNIAYSLQTNSTVKFYRGKFQSPNYFVQLPLQVAIEREAAHELGGQAGEEGVENAAWEVNLKEFPHPAFSTQSSISATAAIFLFAAAMFGMGVQVTNVVTERELGMRQAMRNLGLNETLYWLSWSAWETGMVFVSATLTVLFGMLFNFDIFNHNSYGLTFFLFFLFQMAMTSLGFLLSTFFRKAQTASTAGFIIFIVGWIFQLVVSLGYPYGMKDFETNTVTKTLAGVFAIMPWNLFAKGLGDLGMATVTKESPGLRWEERYSYCKFGVSPQDQTYSSDTYVIYQCKMPLGEVFELLTLLWFVYLVLAMYADRVLPNEHGVRLPVYFFLQPSFWFPEKSGGADELPAGLAGADGHIVDEDVREEAEKMEALLTKVRGGAVPPELAVQLYALRKEFRVGGGCFKRGEDFRAIVGSWFGVGRGELYCLLGPNGAGKSTTINCLTGVLPPSGGEAYVLGERLRSVRGLESIRQRMGVCPQFDALWKELTGREHIEIFGLMKGMSLQEAGAEATKLLQMARLSEATNVPSGAYSGGMKRRLSLMLAFLGSPSVVYLDEPTTGMDPVTRRHVWDIIEEAKAGRCIVLTTHSMEEADILGDRIGIMAKGSLRCVGSSLRLKSRFGAGFRVTVTLKSGKVGSQADLQQLSGSQPDREAIVTFFKDSLDVEPAESEPTYLTFEVPRDSDARLKGALEAFDAQRVGLGVGSVQLSLSTLEDVFLNIARKAELEEAQDKGRKATVTLPDGGEAEVLLGSEEFTHTATGKSYAVRWIQNEAGELIVNDVEPKN